MFTVSQLSVRGVAKKNHFFSLLNFIRAHFQIKKLGNEQKNSQKTFSPILCFLGVSMISSYIICKLKSADKEKFLNIDFLLLSCVVFQCFQVFKFFFLKATLSVFCTSFVLKLLYSSNGQSHCKSGLYIWH